jgi:Xaa-Pro dipeptidase
MQNDVTGKSLTCPNRGASITRVILYHKTEFGRAERHSQSSLRADAARGRLASWLAAPKAPAALVLTRPAAVAWATGGVAPPVDRSADVDLVWAVITPAGAGLITTEVEADRIAEEYQPARHGFTELTAVPWYRPEEFVRAAEELAGAPASRLASDGHPAFGVDAAADLIGLRLALSGPEREDLRALGADAAAALEDALLSWAPGERDLDVQARVAASLEGGGADAPVLIVGGDDRVRRYRHPMAAGPPARHLVMAVVVARRDGLHAAATRFACAGPTPPELRALRARVGRIERATLAASRPGSSYGQALGALDEAYAREGAAGGWAGHYQGGPIGFAQREFEIAPCQRDSRWYSTRIEAGHAVAWNPSLPGGAKAEDTYLVRTDGIERVTTGRAGPAGPAWPVDDGDDVVPPRPAVLEV